MRKFKIRDHFPGKIKNHRSSPPPPPRNIRYRRHEAPHSTPIYLRNKYCNFGVIVAWYTVEGSSNNYREPIIWGSRDGISGHNHPKMKYLFRFYHGLCILWGNKVRISPNSFDKQIPSIGRRRRRKLNSIYSLGRYTTANRKWNMEFPLLAVLLIGHYLYNIKICVKTRLFIP